MALFLSDALSDEELKRLIERAERVRPLALEDLPLGELKRWLEQRFVTEAPNILLPRTVDTDQIADEAITATQITAGTITANEIAAGTITATELSANSVTTDKLAANAVTAEKIAAHTITAAEIAAGTITATEIAAGTITATQIAADTITANEIAANAITTSELAALSVTSAKIASGTIVSGNIAGGTITGGNIAAGTIVAANIAAGTITTAELSATAIDGMTITGSTFRTSAANPRVVMDSTGVYALDASGDVTFFADAASGKITTLAGLGSGNLLINSGAEGGVDAGHWYGMSGGTLSYATDQIAQGEASFKLSAAALGVSPTLWYAHDGVNPVVAEQIAVRPGATYTLSALVYVPSSGGTSQRVAIGYDEYDATHTWVAYIDNYPVTVPFDQWTPVSFTFTVGSTTRYLDLGGYMSAHSSAPTAVWWDNFQLEEGLLQTSWAPAPAEILPATVTGGTGGMIADDTITAANIAAGTITATEIASGTITATQIAAGTITGTQIAANTIVAANIAGGTITAAELAATAIDAMTITGATFRTSSGNPKTQMDGTDGITITNSTGGVLVSLSDDTAKPKLQILAPSTDLLGDRTDNNARIAWSDATGHVSAWVTGFESGTTSALFLATKNNADEFEAGLLIEAGATDSLRLLQAYTGDPTTTDVFATILRNDGMSSFVKDVWEVSGTQNVAASTSAAISGGTENFDSEIAGTNTTYTAPRTGTYLILASLEYQGAAADKRGILTWRKNGVNQTALVALFTNVAGNAVAASGWTFTSLTAADTITAVLTNGDTAARNMAYHLAVVPFGHV